MALLERSGLIRCAAFSWLNFLRRWGLGACLADDMVLEDAADSGFYSKQLASERTSPDAGGLPMSVVGNWQKELHTYACLAPRNGASRVDAHKGQGFQE